MPQTRIRKPEIKRGGDSLMGQVIGANLLLVLLTIAGATVASDLDLSIDEQRWKFGVLVMAIALTLAVNLWMLQRRFRPLERLIEQVERIDPASPEDFEPTADPSEEIERLSGSFKRLLDRIDEERRRAGQLVVRAQEEERRRIARDLHDEVNQALTAVLLRLRALEEDASPETAHEVAQVKLLAGQAMEELLTLARQLRPSALDDHGLVPAIEGMLKQFSAQSGVVARLQTYGDVSELDDDRQIAVYRIVQETLSNVWSHAGATTVDVALAARNGRGVELTVTDDGRGFELDEARPEGIGLKGMAERARLLGGELDVRSNPGAGTSVTLRIG
jgi:two-component system, NarL family, sensor histidine kinase UhpB